MRIRAGTSGYSYKEWKGHFYPERLAAKDMLRFYGERFHTVEINNTFYRMPSESVLKAWAAEVPDDFAFALKASRRITHDKRLQDVGDSVSYLVKTAGALGDRLGPLLFQLPPFLKKDLPRLRELLAVLPAETRSAFEFRHVSWFDDEVYAALRERNAALCVADTGEEGDPPFLGTADWGYLRLRRVAYGEGDLKDWADRVRGQPWSEAFAFFKHEDEATGPKLAARFADLCAA